MDDDQPREKRKKIEDSSGHKEERPEKRKAVDLKAIREEHEKQKAGEGSSRKADLERMQEDLRALKKRIGEDSESDSDDDDKYRRRRKGAVYLEEEMAKYKRGRGRAATRHSAKGRRGDDEDLLRDLGKFSQKVLAMGDDDGAGKERDDDGLEVDDVGWMRHALKFEEEKSDETRRAEEEYTVSCTTAFGLTVRSSILELKHARSRRRRRTLNTELGIATSSNLCELSAHCMVAAPRCNATYDTTRASSLRTVSLRHAPATVRQIYGASLLRTARRQAQFALAYRL